MSDPVLVIAGVFLAGMIFVVLPVVISTYLRYRGRKSVVCPQAGKIAGVRLAALPAALGSAIDLVPLRVTACTLWLDRANCAQGCVESLQRQNTVSSAVG